MAVMVRSGSATHPSNCTRLWCSKYPQSTRKIFLGKLKCVAQAHTTLSIPSLSHQIFTSPSKFPKLSAELLPFLPSVESQSTRYFCCHFASSRALKASLTRNILRYQEEHRRTSSVPLLSSPTTSLLVSFVKSRGTFRVEAIAHPTPVFALYIFDTFPIRTLLTLAVLPPIFASPHFSKVGPPRSARVRHTASVLPIFPLCFTAVQQLGILFFFL